MTEENYKKPQAAPSVSRQLQQGQLVSQPILIAHTFKTLVRIITT